MEEPLDEHTFIGEGSEVFIVRASNAAQLNKVLDTSGLSLPDNVERAFFS
jgi:hypothetical protein